MERRRDQSCTGSYPLPLGPSKRRRRTRPRGAGIDLPHPGIRACRERGGAKGVEVGTTTGAHPKPPGPDRRPTHHPQTPVAGASGGLPPGVWPMACASPATGPCDDGARPAPVASFVPPHPGTGSWCADKANAKSPRRSTRKKGAGTGSEGPHADLPGPRARGGRRTGEAGVRRGPGRAVARAPSLSTGQEPSVTSRRSRSSRRRASARTTAGAARGGRRAARAHPCAKDRASNADSG